jgi:hypothetical protein
MSVPLVHPPVFGENGVRPPLARGMYGYAMIRVICGGPVDGTVTIQIVDRKGHPINGQLYVVDVGSVVPAKKLKAAT